MKKDRQFEAFSVHWTDMARDEIALWVVPDERCGHTVAERLVAGVICDAATDKGMIEGPRKGTCSACVVYKLREAQAMGPLLGTRRGD